MNKKLEEIKEKVDAGERLSREDGIYLFSVNDLLSLGEMAQSVRNRKTGRDVYFNVNRHINLTNICMSRCKFCAFGRDQDDPGAYCMDVEDAVRLGREALPII